MGVNSNGSRISFVAHACRLTLTSEISEGVSKRSGSFMFGLGWVGCSYLE
jgi:hypothetical protein